MLPGFKTSTTLRTTLRDAACRLMFDSLSSRQVGSKTFETIADIASGGTPLRGQSASYGGRIPWAKIGDLSAAGKWIESTEEQLTDEGLQNSSARLFKPGTVFFSMYGSVGKAAIARVPMATNQAILGLTPHSIVSAEYLYYGLIYSRLALFSTAKGTSQMNINARAVRAASIPLPTAVEQAAIVELLSSVEEGRHHNLAPEAELLWAKELRLLARIEELAGQIQEARGLREQAHSETPVMLASQIGQTFSDLALRFPVREFDWFSPHVTSGPRNWGKHYEESGFRFYRAQDIGPHGYVLNDSKVFIAPPPGEQGRSATLERGDLMLVITGATVGRVSLFREDLEPGFVSQHVAICRLPSDHINPEFVLWGLRGPEGQAQLLGQRYGQGKPGLNLSNIRALRLPIPPLHEQRRVVAELDALHERADALKNLQAETAAELDALLPAVLERAFRGML